MKPLFFPRGAPAILAFLSFVLLPAGGWGQAVKDREGAVRGDKAAMERNVRWVYNDWKAGLAEGRRSGKPVMVVLRCVPCLACSGLDAQVLLEDADLKPLLDQFVCVRLINANDLDLSLFQFDYDLSLSVLFFNGDGALYGRFGSWSHQKNAQEKATAGFRRAMEGALELHRGYPANKPSLAGKIGPRPAFATPVDIPTLSGKYKLELDWNGKVVPSCVHCHQIGDALRLHARNRGEPIPSELIYPWPAPETIGLTLAADHAARIEAVTPGSPAAIAGLQAGENLVSLEGQPLVSPADVSWVLHRAGSGPTSLQAEAVRGGERRTLALRLPEGWRRHADISRRSGAWGLRAMALGGLQLEDVPDGERAGLGLRPDQLALRARHVGEYGKHAAAKKAGFVRDDIIVDLGGVTQRMTESEAIGDLLKRPAGQAVATVVLREGKKVDLKLPIQ